ncbi:hypothetical protein C8Q77DRAFT_660929 [Trametes polyzona]|nr:hypothetical protein C8Q77DRAFT_660929 [Trametes polyzona]
MERCSQNTLDASIHAARTRTQPSSIWPSKTFTCALAYAVSDRAAHSSFGRVRTRNTLLVNPTRQRNARSSTPRRMRVPISQHSARPSAHVLRLYASDALMSANYAALRNEGISRRYRLWFWPQIGGTACFRQTSTSSVHYHRPPSMPDPDPVLCHPQSLESRGRVNCLPADILPVRKPAERAAAWDRVSGGRNSFSRPFAYRNAKTLSGRTRRLASHIRSRAAQRWLVYRMFYLVQRNQTRSCRCCDGTETRFYYRYFLEHSLSATRQSGGTGSAR